jgi:hypothetical protein
VEESDDEEELLDELLSSDPDDRPRVPFRTTPQTITPSITTTSIVATIRARRTNRRSCSRMRRSAPSVGRG